MSQAIVLQAPQTPASHLMLLFHGVGATAQDMAPLGRHLAAAFPEAQVVSIGGPDASDLGAGAQWFSVRGVTDANRPERVDATLARFVATVHDWQARTALGPEATTLIGFSQGAIMALASMRWPQPVAGRVVSLSGRLDRLPASVPPRTRAHFIHGAADPVIAPSHASEAATALQRLGAAATLDLVPGMGHTITPAAAQLLVQRLREET